jgi:hypothetical protein
MRGQILHQVLVMTWEQMYLSNEETKL